MSNDDSPSPLILAVAEREETGGWPPSPKAWAEMLAEYRALLDMRIPHGPGQCATALGIHRGCEHDR